MKNLILILLTVITIVSTSCNSNNKNESEELNGTHKVVVKEVIQASAYTYLNVTENNTDLWLAVTTMEAQVGDTYYFETFMEMTNFKSRDLDRTFESIYFLQEIRTELAKVNSADQFMQGHGTAEEHEGKPEISKEEIKVESVEGAITIADLFENREKYNGKRVKIKAKVVKYSPAIMNKNWIHIQDGTSFNGEFDLTITSDESEIKVDDIVTIVGTIILNKDFGYGYKYDVLMEDGVIK